MANENGTNNITYFAETNFRNERKKFGIKREDRTKHVYVIGKTGMGKTTLLENMAIQDIVGGEGIGIIDPHGEFAQKMLGFVPKSRIDDVVYFAPSDNDWPIAFNIMEDIDPTKRHLVASGLLGVFKKIWPDVWSARMEYILNNCILALLEYPGSTLLGINRMLSDKDYRNEVVSKVQDPVVRSFWVDEFAKYTDRFMTEAGAAIQNKVGQFISNPLIRNIIGQPKSTIDMRDVMDKKKILIMNLSKGLIGEENSRLIGAMLITKIYLAAMSRVNVSEKERNDFYLYVDEFQNFATESFKDILAEARKYRLNLILAHQYIAQMDETVRDAVLGNVGTMILFRVGAFDAEVLEMECSPEFTAEDMVNLGFAHVYLRLMIDGVACRPFSATTLPPMMPVEDSHVTEIIEASRRRYAIPKKAVEEVIATWHEPLRREMARIPEARERGYSNFTPAAPRPHFNPPASSPARQRTPAPNYNRQTAARPLQERGNEPPRRTISLRELKEKEKPSSNLSELREVLKGIVEDKEESDNLVGEQKPTTASNTSDTSNHSENNPRPKVWNKGVLKPGDRVKFDQKPNN